MSLTNNGPLPSVRRAGSRRLPARPGAAQDVRRRRPGVSCKTKTVRGQKLDLRLWPHTVCFLIQLFCRISAAKKRAAENRSYAFSAARFALFYRTSSKKSTGNLGVFPIKHRFAPAEGRRLRVCFSPLRPRFRRKLQRDAHTVRPGHGARIQRPRPGQRRFRVGYCGAVMG